LSEGAITAKAYAMNENELAAYCATACALAEWTRNVASEYHDCQNRHNYTGIKFNELVYSNDYMSTFEKVGDALESFKVMRPLDRKCSAMIREPKSDYELIMANWFRGPQLNELLNVFTELYGEYGTKKSGFRIAPNTPFNPNSPVVWDAMKRLALLGYAENTEDGFVWADKIKPIMIAGRFWDEDGELSAAWMK
jgi:hypothetical protein